MIADALHVSDERSAVLDLVRVAVVYPRGALGTRIWRYSPFGRFVERRSGCRVALVAARARHVRG